jgi:hypothetical protein
MGRFLAVLDPVPPETSPAAGRKAQPIDIATRFAFTVVGCAPTQPHQCSLYSYHIRKRPFEWVADASSGLIVWTNWPVLGQLSAGQRATVLNQYWSKPRPRKGRVTARSPRSKPAHGEQVSLEAFWVKWNDLIGKFDYDTESATINGLARESIMKKLYLLTALAFAVPTPVWAADPSCISTAPDPGKYNWIRKWKELSPEDIIQDKRKLDEIIFTYEPFFSHDFITLYNKLISDMFDTNTGWGEDAKLRSEITHREQFYKPRDPKNSWNTKWVNRFTGEDNTSEIRKAYSAFVSALPAELALPNLSDQKIRPISPDQLPKASPPPVNLTPNATP